MWYWGWWSVLGRDDERVEGALIGYEEGGTKVSGSDDITEGCGRGDSLFQRATDKLQTLVTSPSESMPLPRLPRFSSLSGYIHSSHSLRLRLSSFGSANDRIRPMCQNAWKW
jgi:hypothetical protein